MEAERQFEVKGSLKEEQLRSNAKHRKYFSFDGDDMMENDSSVSKEIPSSFAKVLRARKISLVLNSYRSLQKVHN